MKLYSCWRLREAFGACGDCSRYSCQWTQSSASASSSSWRICVKWDNALATYSSSLSKMILIFCSANRYNNWLLLLLLLFLRQWHMKRRSIDRSTNDSSRSAISSNQLIRIAKEHIDILRMDSERERKRIYVFVWLICIRNREKKCPFIRPPNAGVGDAAVCS